MVEYDKEEQIWYSILDPIIEMTKLAKEKRMRDVHRNLYERVRVISAEMIQHVPFKSFLLVRTLLTHCLACTG